MSNYSEVKLAKNVASKIYVKYAVKTVVGVVIAAIVAYGFIASSMTRYVPTNLGYVKMVSPNFPGGYALPGTEVFINPGSNYTGNDFLPNLLASVTRHENVIRGEVIAGPFGPVNWKDYGIQRKNDENLENEYVFKCLDNCNFEGKEIEYGITRATWIMGLPTGDFRE